MNEDMVPVRCVNLFTADSNSYLKSHKSYSILNYYPVIYIDVADKDEERHPPWLMCTD